MSYFIAIAIGVGFAVPLAVLAASIAQGKAIISALESIARQPEAAAPIRTTLIIGLALIESLVLYVLVMAMVFLAPKLPPTPEILKLIGK